MMIHLAFWGSVALVLYAYLGYPCMLKALSLVRDRPVRKGGATPPVSFIITAHNESTRMAEKIENTLAQDYPARHLEILVASDCSTDGTDDVVRCYAPRVRLVRAPVRRGKEAAQQLAVLAASGDVLIFSDVATTLAPNGVSTIVANFSDPTVGCVSSIDRFVDAGGRISGEGAYVRYEMFLRALESRVNSLVGLSGSFFAARRQVCRNWPPDRQSDFTTLLNSVELGLRGVLDPSSAGYYRPITDHRRELQRKVRTVVRGIGVLAGNVRMLNPLRYGLFAWQLASHKLCRWLVPFAMMSAFLANALLVSESLLYTATFGAQIGFYAAVAGGWTGSRNLRIPFFFFLANLAILMAWFRYARGERMVAWSPSERSTALPQSGVR
jgi:cellulose synthase/poly-beta-1,6-N-acetylglucosamine synthase-like glycosyltransferase